jgi:hypothetical protein
MVKREVLIGLTVGLIANFIGLFFAAMILGKGDNFNTVIKTASAEGFLGKLISLGAILNLLSFFIFLKRNQDFRARGVLLATILIAVFTFIINL